MFVDYRTCSTSCVNQCYLKGPRDEPQGTIDVRELYSWTDHVFAPVTEHLGSVLWHVDHHTANACKTI